MRKAKTMGMRHVVLLLVSVASMVGWGRDGIFSVLFQWREAQTKARAVIDDYVCEVVEEAKGVRVIYTDGMFDDDIRCEAKRRGIELEPISMLKKASTVLEEGPVALKRAFENNEDVAIQLGFDLWKQKGRKPPLCSGVLARTGKMPEEDRQRGIEAARRLGERILELYKEDLVDAIPNKRLKQKLRIVQWRIARIACMRAECAERMGQSELARKDEEFADRLDACNAPLQEIRREMEKVRERTLRTVTPREGLRMALARLDFTTARQHAQKVLQTDPEYSPANFAMGMSYLKEEQYNKAASYLRRCVEKNPNDVASWNNLAVVYLRQGLLDEALAAAERAMEAAKVLKKPEVREQTIKNVDRTLRRIQKLREKQTGKLFLPVDLSEHVASRS